MPAQDNINVHSEELQEVLGTPPGWLVRWGTVIACLTFVILLGLAFFVQYPDVIKAPLEIVALNPPVQVISKKNGTLQGVLVADDQEVVQGELLVIYASTATMMDIDTLEAELQYFSGEIYPSDLEGYVPLRNMQLGPLNAEYASFLKNFDEFSYGTMSNNDEKSIRRLNQEIESLQRSIRFEEDRNSDIIISDTIAQRELRRLKKNYSSDVRRYGDLYRKSVLDINRIKKEYKEVASAITNKEQEIERRKRDIAEIRQESGMDNSNFVIAISENVAKLLSGIKSWKSEHLIYAPIDGRVVFYEEFDNEKQTVQIDTKILKIIPPGEIGEIYAKVNLPQNGSGKVEEGQEVVIKINNFPFHEFGVLEGKVDRKSDVAQDDNSYKVEVSLTNVLLTSRGKELDFTQGMQGTAEVITKERRLLYRLFENVFDF